jgi:branched-chain amino acid transport system permease protein
MADLGTYLVQGMGIGALYAVMALPLSIVWSTTGCFDVAVGAYATLGGLTAVRIGLPAGIVCGLAVGLASGALVASCLVILDRRGSRDTVSVLIVGLGLLTAAQSVALWLFGTAPARVNLFSWAWQLAGVQVQPEHALSLAVVTALLLVTTVLLNATSLGRIMRACAQNPHDAPLVGIAPRRVQFIVLMVAGLLGAAAGILLCTTRGLSYDSGLHLVLSALGALILLGVRGPVTAVLGGLLMGVVESLSNGFLPESVAGIVPLAVIAVVLASGRFEPKLAGARA